ncbi:MAG: hypothetical protein KDK48_01460 [Chlamydiia bacterium]|nr:hypothetical protein [Chlamydiia bacterium]
MKIKAAPLLLCAFIASWWGLFLLPEIATPTPLVDDSVLLMPKPVIAHDHLSTIHKKDLLDALTGDVNKMETLIRDWDVDAQVLQALGAKEIKRLPPEALPRLHTLMQRVHKEEGTPKLYYPQTFLAAGILLALAPHTHITALPAGFRVQRHIYPEELTAKIPLDVNHILTEAATPPGSTIAFISPLSHPPTLHALKRRGIQLIDLGNVTEIDHLAQSIALCGKWTGREERAELLNLFVQAAVMALENRLQIHRLDDVAYLEYRTTLTVPTTRTLAGNLIDRLKLSTPFKSSSDYGFTTPVEFEELQRVRPKTLIIAVSHSKQKEELLARPVIANLIKNGSKAYFVQRGTYETASQFFLLGYFDLCSILAARA